MRAPSLRVVIFTDTTVVPGLGISQRLFNVDQICYLSSISVVGLRIPV